MLSRTWREVTTKSGDDPATIIQAVAQRMFQLSFFGMACESLRLPTPRLHGSHRSRHWQGKADGRAGSECFEVVPAKAKLGSSDTTGMGLIMECVAHSMGWISDQEMHFQSTRCASAVD